MLVLFHRFRSALSSFYSCMRGATAIEYALIGAGISIAIVAVVFTIGEDLFALFESVDTELEGASERAGGG